MSLRVRLLLAVGAVALIALVAADVVTYTQLKSFLYNRVDSDLAQSVTPGLREHADTGKTPEGPTGPIDGSGSSRDSSAPGYPVGSGPGDTNPGYGIGHPSPNGVSVFIEVLSSDGTRLSFFQTPFYGSTKYVPSIPKRIGGYSPGTDGDQVAYISAGSTRPGGPVFRVLAEKLTSGRVLVVAEPVSDVLVTLNDLEIIEIIVSACALVVAAALGWWLVRRGLRPLVVMERTAESIAEGELGERVPVENEKTEVGRLAKTLNVMLSRIQQAFAQRDATEADLRASEERLRRFVGDASHELRTPLAAVSAYAELFERGASEHPEDLGRLLHGIRSETARMGRLVEDLLLLARLDEGVPVAKEPVELVGLVAEAIRTARTVGPEWPVHLVATQPVEVDAEGSRLRQVIDNLLSNVRSHTPSGTETTVTVSESVPHAEPGPSDPEAVIEVADRGPGLTDEQASKIFERFYRTDVSRSRASGGAGLGLSIAASIVLAHGGTVSASPRPGGGSVFTVRLPLGRSRGTQTTEPAPKERVRISTGTHS